MSAYSPSHSVCLATILHLGIMIQMILLLSVVEESGVVLQICMLFEGSRAVGTKRSEVASMVSGLSTRGSEVKRGSTKSE